MGGAINLLGRGGIPIGVCCVLAIGAAALLFSVPAHADPECRPAGPISSGLQKLIKEFRTSDKAGRGALSVQDFLVGVSEIPSSDESALDRRGTVKVAGSGTGSGSIANDGLAPLEFAGIFAGRQTYFRVPEHIRARYVSSGDALMLYYEAGQAIQVGEALPLLNVPVYRTINHVRVTGDKLLFFWGDNTSADPDRCYVAS